MRGRVEICVSGFILAALCAVAGPAAGSPAAYRAATCSFSAAQHRLTVSSADLRALLEIRRTGQELVVSQYGANVRCGATAPRVGNVDEI